MIKDPLWSTHEWTRMTNGPQVVEPAGRPVDCLGLTKRWSLYVASHGNSRVWVEDAARPTHELHPILTG